MFRSDKSMQSQITDLHKGKQQILYQIYPNPVRDKLQININPVEKTAIEISLFDMFGRLISKISAKEIIGSYSEIIRMSDLPSGNYLLKIHTDTEITNEIIVKL